MNKFNTRKKWFEPDATARFKLKSLDPEIKILADGGWGQGQIDGYKAVLSMGNKILIFSGCREIIRDEYDEQKWTKDKKKAFGHHWTQVHFKYREENVLDDQYRVRIYSTVDWSSEEECAQAIEIIIDYISTMGTYDERLVVAKSIQFSQGNLKINEQNPIEIIKVNKDVY